MLFPLLVGLGFWQLQRADYKQGLQELYDQQSAAAAVDLSVLKFDQNTAYLPVKLVGRFDNRHHFLLDNRIFKGRPGYEVISVFRLEPAVRLADGQLVQYVWVNRGWLPMGASRSRLPNIPSVAGMQQIHGQLVTPAAAFELAAVPLSGNWPEVIQSVKLAEMNARLGEQQSLPMLLRLRAGEAGSFTVSWQPINTAPQKSLGYAIQWFLMALVLTGLYFWAAFKTTDERENQ